VIDLLWCIEKSSGSLKTWRQLWKSLIFDELKPEAALT
jgi:hypothetical protein